MTALEAATQRLERAIARLEAAEAANGQRLKEMRERENKAAADADGGAAAGLVEALQAVQTENDELIAFNEDIVGRLDGAIRRLNTVLAGDGAGKGAGQ